MGQYNKIEYWGNRQNPNNKSGIQAVGVHTKIVEPFIDDNLNILEYGPGIGRMVDLYRSQDQISFYDISSIYKDRLQEKCKNIGLKIDQCIIDDSGEITTPFNDNEFDVVCVFEVLLHCPETEIAKVINELSRIAKKVLVVTWYDGGKSKCVGHCWTRDYKAMLIENGMGIVHWDENSLPQQTFFIYEKNK
jgi:SAM-dependent methyltransferase